MAVTTLLGVTSSEFALLRALVVIKFVCIVIRDGSPQLNR